jgi:hypothetical protein
MRERTQWLISVGSVPLAGAVLFFVAVAFSPSPLLDIIMKVFFWPVSLCVGLVPPEAGLAGPPNRHWREGTPIHLLAALVGLAITWIFWSGVVFLIVRTLTKGRHRGLRVAG